MKGFLLRPFDERSMSETLAFSALVHAMLFFSGTLLAWLLPRYIEPFPSTRVEIISEAELQQRLKTYRTEAKTTPRETLPQEQPATEQPTTEQQKAEQPTAKQPTEQSAAVKKPPKERVGEATTQEKPKDTIDGLLTALEETSNEEASLEESLEESLDAALAESEIETSFLTSESVESVLTQRELATFRRHITQCWSPPVGAPALENLVVDLLLTIDGNAYVVDALVMDRARMTSDPFFRSAAEAALRTLSDAACSPLRLPLEKHALWKKTVLRFDPRSLFGGN